MSLYAVIGPGAVGSAVALQLQLANLPYALIARSGVVAASAIKIQNAGETCVLSGAAASDFSWSKVSCVFICVKSYDLLACMAAIGPDLPAGTTVIVVANGAIDMMVANAAKIYSKVIWRIGVAQFGVREVAEGFALVGTGGQLIIGALRTESPSESELLLSRWRGDFFVLQSDITPVYRRKWLINVTANTVAAVLRLERNELLLEHLALLQQVFTEGYELGIRLWGPWSQSRAELWQALNMVIGATAANENSMVRDLRLRRHTESAYLAGMAKPYADLKLLQQMHAQIEVLSQAPA